MSFRLNDVPLLSRTVIDRAEGVRADPDALAGGWAKAAVLRVNERGKVPFADGAVVLEAAAELGPRPPAGAVFLGMSEGRHLWAIRDPEVSGELRDLRAIGQQADDFTADLLATAYALLNWHDRSGFHGADGSATTPGRGGWTRLTATGEEDFPRTDPAVICLVHDGRDQVLLARQHSWPETLFSLLAGFVEAGESLERCVQREIAEEVGVEVGDITYLGSQPWPFPRSLMIGFAAVADPEQPLVFADGEIVEAHWFTRAEVRVALAAGDWSAPDAGATLVLPGSISIARTMLESWAGTTN